MVRLAFAEESSTLKLSQVKWTFFFYFPMPEFSNSPLKLSSEVSKEDQYIFVMKKT